MAVKRAFNPYKLIYYYMNKVQFERGLIILISTRQESMAIKTFILEK